MLRVELGFWESRMGESAHEGEVPYTFLVQHSLTALTATVVALHK
jgi:hypothetical protein